MKYNVNKETYLFHLTLCLARLINIKKSKWCVIKTILVNLPFTNSKIVFETFFYVSFIQNLTFSSDYMEMFILWLFCWQKKLATDWLRWKLQGRRGSWSWRWSWRVTWFSWIGNQPPVLYTFGLKNMHAQVS